MHTKWEEQTNLQLLNKHDKALPSSHVIESIHKYINHNLKICEVGSAQQYNCVIFYDFVITFLYAKKSPSV